ncbi:D-inositol-3-phosphate glycosyltransferase [Caulifigura coniformis]|uniref:D-inositol-3-phosphate glycosyltransferase n=1 Tax=Caulifigura coniformis TaxID=2527983 RepID=A0A517SI93_9PLAN|nr:glycosyltransferase [Caulifigura coniformis]QDT55840.1 D-inositol-3-phosphate glycosyltransferase [Caulifigura coniformis]
MSQKTLVYFAPVGEGGLSIYAAQQVAAIAACGVRVHVIGSKSVVRRLPSSPLIEVQELPESEPGKSRVSRGLAFVRQAVSQVKELVASVRRVNAPAVLISAYSEYFSPMWAGSLRRLHRQGTRFGVIVHDPQRDFVVGPRLWHEFSVSQAYSFIDVAFVHGEGPIDTGRPSRQLHRVTIRHGLLDTSDQLGKADRGKHRAEFGLPSEAPVLLSFGHIRDGKNLDLIIRALAQFPEAHLLVVGREQSGAQRPIAEYHALAEEVGVAGRCHWVHDFVPDEDVFSYFDASDIAMITYSREFCSASGVLSAAVRFERRVVASAGGGPLQPDVEEYHLGTFCEPDCEKALAVAIRSELENPSQPQWERYRRDHSWEANAQTCLAELGVV